MSRTSRFDGSVIGQWLVGLALVLLSWWLLRLQARSWPAVTPLLEPRVIAGVALAAYAAFCGWIAWRGRMPRIVANTDGQAPWRVIHASQTGFALDLAQRTAQALRDAGLRRITVSLDTLDAGLFRALSGGRGELRDTLAGIEAAQAAGFAPVKLNCVVQRGVNDAGIEALAAFAREHGHLLRFIEYMDVGTCNGWSRARVLPSVDLHDRIAARWPLRPLDPNYRGEVASRYAYADGRGEIGFVSSVSEPFCGDCHRARVSADGRLYTCLFAAQGHDLREVLVGGEEALATHVAARWSGRADRYSEIRSEAGSSRKHVEMYLVGG